MVASWAAPPFEPPPPSEHDPHVDRVVLLPTATTHPKGTIYISSYEVFLPQLGYAFTDDTQLTATVFPIPNEGIAFIDLSLKTALVRGPRVRVAALGSATGLAGKEIGVLFIGRAGAVAQLCGGNDCQSSFSLSTNVAFIGPVLAMINGVGGIWRVSHSVSLLGELATVLPVGRELGQLNGAMLSGGVRFHLDHWGIDLALMRLLEVAGPTLPLIAISYRS